MSAIKHSLGKSPLVSVIIPSYNHDQFIKQAIESVVNQTYDNIDLIVVDDGSTDNTVGIVEQLLQHYSFTFIKQPNLGVSCALNTGIKAASGEYFCFLASDDFYFPDKISRQVDFYLRHEQFGFIHGGAVPVDTKGLEISRPDYGNVNWNTGDIFEILLNDCFISAPTVMVKRSVFDVVGFFDEDIAIEDWDMWLRISKIYKVGFQPEYLVCYRIHASNTFFSKNESKVLSMIGAERAILEKWKDERLYPSVLARRKLKWFYRLSGVNRGQAFKFFFAASRFFFDPLFYKGVLILMLGRSTVNKIKMIKPNR